MAARGPHARSGHRHKTTPYNEAVNKLRSFWFHAFQNAILSRDGDKQVAGQAASVVSTSIDIHSRYADEARVDELSAVAVLAFERKLAFRIESIKAKPRGETAAGAASCEEAEGGCSPDAFLAEAPGLDAQCVAEANTEDHAKERQEALRDHRRQQDTYIFIFPQPVF